MQNHKNVKAACSEDENRPWRPLTCLTETWKSAKNLLHAASYTFNHCIKSVVPERSSAVPHQLEGCWGMLKGTYQKKKCFISLKSKSMRLRESRRCKGHSFNDQSRTTPHHVGARFMKWKDLKCFLNQMRYEHKEEVKTSSKSSLTSSGDGTVHTANSSWDKSLNWSPWSSWAAVWIFYFNISINRIHVIRFH